MKVSEISLTYMVDKSLDWRIVLISGVRAAAYWKVSAWLRVQSRKCKLTELIVLPKSQ
jgi:hypothetical protein